MIPLSIGANKKDVSRVALVCGDPIRARWIAKQFLKRSKLITKIRAMYGFTGYYKGKKITIMGHGMGCPSIGIYSYELFKFYNVNTIIRIGSCGSFSNDYPLGTVLVCKQAYSESIYAKQIGIKVPKNKILKPSSLVFNCLMATSKLLNKEVFPVNMVTDDAFFHHVPWQQRMKLSPGLKAVEMEAFALYANAIKLKKRALCLATVSDVFPTKEWMSIKKRETSFKRMVEVALETAVKL